MTLRKRTDYLVVHVTATPPTSDIGAAEVRKMHLAQGWSDIGYHYVIRRNGKVEKGRDEKAVGSHVKGFNSISLGVSLVGGVDAKGKPEHNATPEQMAALEALLRDLAARYPDAKVCGHRDLSPDKDGDGIIESGEWLKACPCFDAIPWAKSLGLPAANIRGAWDKEAPDGDNIHWQTLLARGGYKFGPLDGVVGKNTAKAIRAFQAFEKLPSTGKFDAATIARLKAKFGAEPKPVLPTPVPTQIPEPTKEAPMPVKNTSFNTVFDQVEKVLKRDHVPVENKDIGKVTAEVTSVLAPIFDNATNREPWYKSRIYLGLITAGVGLVGMKLLGVTITQDDVLLAGDGITSIVTTLGILYALYGRIVGTKKPPLGGK